jgi:hypothetical protein
MLELKAKSGQLRACCLLRKRRAEGSETIVNDKLLIVNYSQEHGRAKGQKRTAKSREILRKLKTVNRELDFKHRTYR